MHIGSAIKQVFNDMPKRCTVQWFADMLCCDKRNIYRIFERENIDVKMLERISIILKHNFFEDLSKELKVLTEECHNPSENETI